MRFDVYLAILLIISSLWIHPSYHMLPDNQIEFKDNDLSFGLNTFQFDNLLPEGTYLIKGNLYDPMRMEKIQDLETVPYTIIKSHFPLKHEPGIYSNQELKLDLPAPIDPSMKSSHSIDIEPVWNSGYNGSGVVIAIVDTGINFSHPALFGKRVMEKSFHRVEYGFGEDLGPQDTHGHGTAVASVAAGDDGSFKGSAFDAKLVNARIGLTPSETTTTLSVIAALDWAISLDEVDIVSMSLSETEEGYDFDPLEEVVNAGVKNGKIILSSAGNSADKSKAGYQIGSPSSAPEVISVGATTGTGFVSSYSSRGPNYSNEAKPDIVAPGNGIEVAKYQGGYRYLSGTSFSTPMVAGIMGTLVQAALTEGIPYTPGMMKALVLNSTTDLGVAHYDQGFGQVNASKSLDNLLANNNHPVIGPSQFSSMPISYTLPVNTPVRVPLSLIGFDNLPTSVQSSNPNISISYSFKYSGHTSIMNVDLTAENFMNISNLEIYLNYKTSDNIEQTITYPLNVEIRQEPDFHVLLDLKHTLFDTLFDSKVLGERLERLRQVDITPLSQQILESNGWITELLDGSYTLSTLMGYDVIWMPSAFSVTADPLYDHDYMRSELTTNELFILSQYLDNGGSLMVDFDGISAYDSEFTISSDYSSISMLNHLLGTTTELIYSGIESEEAVKISPIVNYTGTVAKGDLRLNNGILLSGDQTGASALAKFSNGGRIYLHNSRNWRVPHGSIDVSTDYMNDIIEFMAGINQNITGYEIKTDRIEIIGNNFFPDPNPEDPAIYLPDVDLFVNGIKIDQVTRSISSENMTIYHDFEAYDQIYLNISINNSTLSLSETYNPNNLNLEDMSVSLNGTSFILTSKFNEINFLSSTTRLVSPGLDTYFGYINNDGLNYNLPASIDIELLLSTYSIQVIDEDGNMHQFHIGNYLGPEDFIVESSEEPQDQDSTDSGNILIVTVLAAMIIALVISVIRRNLVGSENKK